MPAFFIFIKISSNINLKICYNLNIKNIETKTPEHIKTITIKDEDK